MSLSDEDKKRIQEEENYRVEARKKAEKNLGDDIVVKTTNSGRSGCLYIVLFFFALIFIVGIFNAASPEERKRIEAKREVDKCQNDKGAAWVMSTNMIQPRLKSPTSADFQGGHTNDKVFPMGDDCKYKILSYVDSQNSFGATIRTHFEAVVKYQGNDKWTLLSLEFAK